MRKIYSQTIILDENNVSYVNELIDKGVLKITSIGSENTYLESIDGFQFIMKDYRKMEGQ